MASVDGSRTLQGASDEFHTNVCGACKTVDVERGASHYCKDCSVYLCDHCEDHHRKLPLTKNHRIVSESQAPAVTSKRGRPAIVIYCSCNKNQDVQHFCDDHQDAVCDACKHTKHYKCKVSSIKDKSSGYNRSRIDCIMSKIKALEDDYDQLKKTRNDQSKRLGRSKGDCKKEINACRKELNNFLDDLEKSILKLLDFQEDEGQKRLDQHISALTETLKMLKTDSKLLQDAKQDGESALMFAADFQVSKGLHDYEERLSDMVNDAINTDIRFEKNTKLANLQTEIDSLGSLFRISTRDIQRGRQMLLDSKIQLQKQVNVKMSDDSSQPSITGSVVMPTGDIVLCDCENDKIKLLDRFDILKDSVKLNAWPLDISVVDTKSVIVTLPTAKQLQYIDVFPRLTLGRVLQLDKQCWGVHVTGDKIFTSCHNWPGEGEVRILDLDGNVLQQLGINQDGSFLFTRPSYITVNQSERKLFVSDAENAVTCMTMYNHVIYQYRDNKMKYTRGLYCDGGDNILVCGMDSNNLHVITAEGKKHCELVSSRKGLTEPSSISYRESDDSLVVGQHGSDGSDVCLFKLWK